MCYNGRMTIVADLPGESRPARFEPLEWPPKVLPLPTEEPVREEPTPLPERAPAPAPEREPVPA